MSDHPATDSLPTGRDVFAAQAGPAPLVHLGDNLQFMQSLSDAGCDLIYLDPPFLSQKTRRSQKHDGEFNDRWRGGASEYMAFLSPRLAECRRLLPEHGTLYVHVDYRVSHVVRLELDRLFGAENFLNEIIWHYRTGGVASRWFARKHDTILVYARRLGRHVFNPIREGEFRTEGLLFDEAGRPFKRTRKGPVYFDPRGPALSDVWDIPFLSTVSLERVDWPTQKPLKLLERIVQASSEPGATVADFFCGSGTTLVAAARLGRAAIGCDLAPRAVDITRARLSTAQS